MNLSSQYRLSSRVLKPSFIFVILMSVSKLWLCLWICSARSLLTSSRIDDRKILFWVVFQYCQRILHHIVVFCTYTMSDVRQFPAKMILTYFPVLVFVKTSSPLTSLWIKHLPHGSAGPTFVREGSILFLKTLPPTILVLRKATSGGYSKRFRKFMTIVSLKKSKKSFYF